VTKHSLEALVILCIAQLFNLGTGNVTIILLMVGKSSWNLINSAVSLTVNVGLNLILIPRLGITGAAIAWAASIVVSNLAAVLEVHYLLRIRPFGSGYWVVATSSLFCFGLTGVVIRSVVGAGLPAIALFAILSTGLYAAVLWQARSTLHLSSLLAAIPRRRSAPIGR
jgi:O-antigen/teichoic acid export membrane protein